MASSKKKFNRKHRATYITFTDRTTEKKKRLFIFYLKARKGNIEGLLLLLLLFERIITELL